MIDEDGQAGALVVLQVIAERDLGVGRAHDHGQLRIGTMLPAQPGAPVGEPHADFVGDRQPPLLIEATKDKARTTKASSPKISSCLRMIIRRGK